MERITENTITFWHSLLNAGLFVGSLILCLSGYMGIESVALSHMVTFLLVILICTTVQSFRGKLRLYAILVLGILGMFFIGTIGIEKSTDFIKEYGKWLIGDGGWEEEYLFSYQLMQVAVLSVIGYASQLLMEKYLLLRRISAFVLLGCLCLWMFEEYQIPKAGASLAITYIFLVLIEWIQQRWNKIRKGNFKAHMFWIMPFMILYLFLFCLMPAPKEPYSWQWVMDLWYKVREKLTIVTENIMNTGQEDFGMTTSGFSEEGQLWGGLLERNEPVMVLQGKAGLVTNVYLTGKTFDDFDGRSWLDTNESTQQERLLDTLETAYAVERYDREDTTDYIRAIDIRIKYEYFHTGYLFAPLKTSQISGLKRESAYTQKGNDLLFEKQKGYGTMYNAEFHQLNLAHPDFKKLMEAETLEDEEAWKRVLRQFGRKNSVYPIEKLYSYRQEMKELYLKEPKLSAEAENWLSKITQGAPNDVEKLKCIEQELRKLKYSLRPGELPESITGEAEFLDYFLLESKEGYCSYFATAFVLLARAEGIPARYVQGFCVPIENKAETVVYSGMAHAWPEAYLEGIGWIPFEPTPGYEVIREVSWETKEDKRMKETGQNAFLQEEWETEEYTAASSIDEKPEKEQVKDSRPLILMVGKILIVIVSLLGVLIAMDLALEKQRNKRRSPEEKFYLLVHGNFQILAMLGYKRAEEETFYELRKRVERALQADVCPVCFIEEYEQFLYGKAVPDEEWLQGLQKEREQLLRLLKQMKNKYYLIYRGKLYLLRASRYKSFSK